MLIAARGDLLAQAFFLGAQLRGELGAEVLGLEDLADLDLALSPSNGFGARLTHSIASASESVWNSQ